MPALTVVDTGGVEAELTARLGESAMQVIRAHGVPGFGECSGSLACATCHVIVDDAWAGKIPPITPDEEDMLDTAFDVTPTSRLSCQIAMTADLDGLRVRLPG